MLMDIVFIGQVIMHYCLTRLLTLKVWEASALRDFCRSSGLSHERQCYGWPGYMISNWTSFKNCKTDWLLKSGSLPRNIAGWSGICCRDGKWKCFFRWPSSSRHSIRTWSTVKGSPHLTHAGGSPPVNRYECVLYVCPMRSRQNMTSVWRDFPMGGQFPSCGLIVWSLLCVLVSHKRCQYALRLLLRRGFKSITGTAMAASATFVWTHAASLSACTFPSISRCPGTQHTTTYCLSVYILHNNEYSEVRIGFLCFF